MRQCLEVKQYKYLNQSALWLFSWPRIWQIVLVICLSYCEILQGKWTVENIFKTNCNFVLLNNHHSRLVIVKNDVTQLVSRCRLIFATSGLNLHVANIVIIPQRMIHICISSMLDATFHRIDYVGRWLADNLWNVLFERTERQQHVCTVASSLH